MNKRNGIIIFLFLFLTTVSGFSQKSVIKVKDMEMKTYMFSDPNPIPNIGRIYPYFRFDGFTNIPIQKKWKMVILENPYIKVFVCPDIGGKIWGAIEKSTGKEFLYFNHVVKFRDIGMRGPWTSGGLEYNFGAIGHIPTCATPVDYVVKENSDGSVSCIVGALDLPSRTKWNVEIRLEPDKAYFETKATWVNNTPLPNTYYHWMNAAAKASKDLRFIYPGNRYVGHGGEPGNWNIENGRDISLYKNNNFGKYKSYHVINSYTNFFGGYWEKEDFGFGHISNYDDKPGKKLWIWGLSRQGMIWENLLTDRDGQYIEFQAGKLFNQAAHSSTLTPFKHKEFPSGDADVMVERWFPIVKTGGMVAASKYAVMNVLRKNNKIVLKISALSRLNDTVEVFLKKKLIFNKKIKLNPLELAKISLNIKSNEFYRVVLKKSRITYSSNPSNYIVERPVKPNPDFNWNSAYGLYIKGYEEEKQRHYKEAEKYYNLSLKKEKGFAPSLNRKALLLYRKMDCKSAKYFAKKSMAIDTYDPLANYIFGLSCEKLGEKANARSGFSIAAASVGYRSSSYIALARSYLRDRNYEKAFHYARKALDYNRFNITAYEIKAVVMRKLNKIKEEEKILKELEKIDPTLHFIYFEKYLIGNLNKESFLKTFYNELPVESFLELSIFYHNIGFNEDAKKLLLLSPENPIVFLWLSKLDNKNQNNWMKKALKSSIKFVFPYREETAEILKEFIPIYDNWKLKYYLGLIYWNKGVDKKAKNLFKECEDKPSELPFYLAKAKLFSDNESIMFNSIKRARKIAPDDWRAALIYFRYMNEHNHSKEILKSAEEFVKKYPEKPALGEIYSKALIKSGYYKQAIKFLENYNMLPFEGDTGGRVLYHKACIFHALKEMKNGNYTIAIQLFEKGKRWPENLGAGKPYDVDERLENYFIAVSLEKLGRKIEAERLYTKIANPIKVYENSKLIFTLLSLKKLNKKKVAEKLLDNTLLKYPENLYIRWVKALFYNNISSEKKILKKIYEKERIIKNPYDTSYKDPEFDIVLRAIKFLK